ncbi:response regulator [Thiovibrio sp. JS02]
MHFPKIQKILVADDNEIMAHSLERHLKREGFEVVVSAGGAMARDLILAAKLLGEPFDLAITDIRRPGGNGFSFIPWLNREFPEVAVLLISGFGNADLLDSHLRPAQDCFRKKPVLPGEIVAAILCIEQKREMASRPGKPPTTRMEC